MGIDSISAVASILFLALAAILIFIGAREMDRQDGGRSIDAALLYSLIPGFGLFYMKRQFKGIIAIAVIFICLALAVNNNDVPKSDINLYITFLTSCAMMFWVISFTETCYVGVSNGLERSHTIFGGNGRWDFTIVTSVFVILFDVIMICVTGGQYTIYAALALWIFVLYSLIRDIQMYHIGTDTVFDLNWSK